MKPSIEMEAGRARELALFYGDESQETGLGYRVVANRATGNASRWTEEHELVVRPEGAEEEALYLALYNIVLTEYQEHRPFDDVETVIFYWVAKHEETVTVVTYR